MWTVSMTWVRHHYSVLPLWAKKQLLSCCFSIELSPISKSWLYCFSRMNLLLIWSKRPHALIIHMLSLTCCVHCTCISSNTNGLLSLAAVRTGALLSTPLCSPVNPGCSAAFWIQEGTSGSMTGRAESLLIGLRLILGSIESVRVWEHDEHD